MRHLPSGEVAARNDRREWEQVSSSLTHAIGFAKRYVSTALALGRDETQAVKKLPGSSALGVRLYPTKQKQNPPGCAVQAGK